MAVTSNHTHNHTNTHNTALIQQITHWSKRHTFQSNVLFCFTESPCIKNRAKVNEDYKEQSLVFMLSMLRVATLSGKEWSHK